MNLAVNKASGPDIISHKMLQVSPEEIAVPLPIIFSKSLEQCEYGTALTTVLPILFLYLNIVIVTVGTFEP
jgi:hypothetical protein